MGKCSSGSGASTGQPGMQLTAAYQHEAYAGFHVLTLLTESAPLLVICRPHHPASVHPWQLCEAGI